MIKTLDENFVDWEGAVFGFGYGSGEPHTIGALKAFLTACPLEGGYDYEVLEQTLTPTATWLLINILARADIIEYGTSPRYGWLTPAGVALKSFVDARDVESLVELATNRPEGYCECYPDVCNCGAEKCVNPFWRTVP